jgi:hypothetical protein
MRRIAVAALLALSACPGQDRELSRAVREYDDALVSAYASSDPSRVEGVAAPKEADRIRVLIDLKTSARLALESTLESFEVTSATGAGEMGTVETRERWRYRDRPLQPGAPSGPEIASVMRMRYSLVREGGRWKVASVATIANERIAAPGGPPR